MLCSIDLDVTRKTSEDDDSEDDDSEDDDSEDDDSEDDDSEDDDLDYLWSFQYTWLKFVAGSWMDGGATSRGLRP